MFDLVVVGLGNPGKNYLYTRHNVGFLVLDYIVQQQGLKFDSLKKCEAVECKLNYLNSKILLIKPTTFMNCSGICVKKVLNYYKISIEHLIVIYDDLDIKFGKCRAKSGRSHAGHNGIKSVNSHISNDYLKLRIGIGSPFKGQSAADYVLDNFSNSELKKVRVICELISDNFDLLLQKNLEDLRKLSNNVNQSGL